MSFIVIVILKERKRLKDLVFRGYVRSMVENEILDLEQSERPPLRSAQNDEYDLYGVFITWTMSGNFI